MTKEKKRRPEKDNNAGRYRLGHGGAQHAHLCKHAFVSGEVIDLLLRALALRPPVLVVLHAVLWHLRAYLLRHPRYLCSIKEERRREEGRGEKIKKQIFGYVFLHLRIGRDNDGLSRGNAGSAGGRGPDDPIDSKSKAKDSRVY